MIETLARIAYTLTHDWERLGGGEGFYPMPSWLRSVLSRLPIHEQVRLYARLVNGQRIYQGIEKEVACANSVTGLLEMVDPTFFGGHATIDRINGTYTLLEAMVRSPRFEEIPYPRDGCVVMSATGTGNGTMIGHVGISDGNKVWNNNSKTGLWLASYTHLQWQKRWASKEGGGIKTRYFLTKLAVKK